MRSLLKGIFAAGFSLALGAASGPASAATVLNVNWGDGCGKTSCFNENGVHTQTFSAKDFGGPVTIGQLLMQRGVLGDLDGSTFRISFQLNGQEIGTWGQYNMAGIGGDELGFAGENFQWNPEDGDLTLVLAITPPPRAGGGGGFARSAPVGFSSGAESEALTPPGEDGPSSGPEQSAIAAVPEPATWAMMIVGFGMAGGLLRRPRPLAA